MSKLYVFGIGGTGARVLRTLTMLLAAGVDCGVDIIVPIIIDGDTLNADLTRTKLLIDDYIAVHSIAEKTKRNKFFKTKIQKLDNRFELALKGEAKKFDDFIGKSTMSRENQALVDMLFSKETLHLDMTVGFQGNPNIGSVVLNQFDENEIFKAFSKDFQDGDKIFIISSIFGGTGASGFPLLLKILNEKISDKNKGLDNWGMINKAPKGAVSVLPYFKVSSPQDDSLVNSDTFTDKTKAALSYYKTLYKQLDSLYYVADNTPSTYKHHKGGGEQKNDANFIELTAALAVLDFVNLEKNKENYHNTVDEPNKVSRDNTTYGEFGFLPDKGTHECAVIDFTHLCDETKKLLVEPLTRFTLFCKYMGYTIVDTNENGKTKKEVVKSDNNVFDKRYNQQPYSYSLVRPAQTFKDTAGIKKLIELQAKFYEWLLEMDSEKHTRKFYPMNLEKTKPFDFVKGSMNIVSTPKWFDSIRYKNWARVDNELNRQIRNTDKALKAEERFLELFYRVTESLVKL
jgi:hypothetical protein